MAIEGYVFAVTKEIVKDGIHQLGLLGFYDTQDEAMKAVEETILILDMKYEIVENETDVIYTLKGTTAAFPDAQYILRIKIITVANALNMILARAKR